LIESNLSIKVNNDKRKVKLTTPQKSLFEGGQGA
jgi:hypothetical protein